MKSTTHHRDLLVLYWMLLDEITSDQEAPSESTRTSEPAVDPSKSRADSKVP